MQQPLHNILAVACLSACLTACSSAPDTGPTLEAGARSGDSSTSKQWVCQGNGSQDWQCSEWDGRTSDNRSGIAIAPRAESVEEEAQAEIAASPAPEVAVAPIAESPSINQLLREAPADAVVIQLIAATEQQTINRYINAHPELPVDQISVRQNNQQWQLLILGPYASREEASAVVSAFPDLSDTPWIRSVDSLRAALIRD